MTVDEKRRRSRRWCRLVSGPSTAVELYTVQKASPCGKTVSASANSQRGGFYGGISTAGRELSVNFQAFSKSQEWTVIEEFITKISWLLDYSGKVKYISSPKSDC
ncbi:uncharacterized protein [Struthio camelus]|uniref:uncharacterized protein isoform X4 n=1 Tax=Struthio camelus TaxID=8801 RepID=UPI003603E5ED